MLMCDCDILPQSLDQILQMFARLFCDEGRTPTYMKIHAAYISIQSLIACLKSEKGVRRRLIVMYLSGKPRGKEARSHTTTRDMCLLLLRIHVF